ncbi:hypothetical protein CYMTET_4549 [Cymbomonas tetramitiformis]|uniref:Uncharacterized protein n=1 Tax=Cymbomonas tetramitiformis TaxID=36881 RepID=A0AAE0H114_9CHLO|nr:hypothetical protein CYMTET_4549 [Cymbomonas tetramitiformis]
MAGRIPREKRPLHALRDVRKGVDTQHPRRRRIARATTQIGDDEVIQQHVEHALDVSRKVPAVRLEELREPLLRPRVVRLRSVGEFLYVVYAMCEVRA